MNSGLRRINNTTEAVTTAISASNGLVATVMTVRVNKQPFNFREKLSELERPKIRYELMAETAQDARDLVSAGRKNMIINGAMLISQRYSTAQSIPSGSQPIF